MRRRWQRSHHPSHAGEVDAAAPLACSSLQLHRFDTATSLCSSLVDLLERELRQRLTATTAARPLGLATGRTMEPVYAGLVQRLRSWSVADRQRLLQVWSSFNLDEYVGLAGTDPRSYRTFMDVHLGQSLQLPAAALHLPDGEAPEPDVAAARYARSLQASGGIGLQLLGLGTNGHVGFNEPPCSWEQACHVVTLSEATRQQNAPMFGGDAAAVPRQAITLGLAEILAAQEIHLVVTGRSKAPVLARLLAMQRPDASLPASWLLDHPRVQLWADVAALSLA